MTHDDRTGTEVLEPDECWELLAKAVVGRLAVAPAGRPEIFPINHVVSEQHIVFRTGEGTKLASVAVNHHVAFEVDGYEPGTHEAWSVVVLGSAERLEHFADIYEADELPLFPWSDHPKQMFVRISPREVTGRRFRASDRAQLPE
jgi:nitroimidazol reductase NimA-like FMN-containing flavoprotein (pyridoxamine 5'-phosphate oxidase superfamily)